MEGTSTEQNIFDVQETVRSKEDIAPFIVTAQSRSGCDTVAQCHGLGKMMVIKRLKLCLLGQMDSNMDDVIKDATLHK